MRYILLAFAIASAANSLPAQQTLPSKPKQEPPCTVAGRVVTAAEGNPLKSAYVILIQEHGGTEPNVYGATSDSDGRFLLKNVAPGRYQFSASRTGYVTEHFGSNGTYAGAVFALRPGQEVSDVLFRMTQAAVITGRVSDEDSEPMANIHVVALRKRSEEEIEDEGPFASRQQELIPAASARTDDRGKYRLFGLKPGNYYVRATDSMSPDFDGVMQGRESFARERLGSQYAPVFYPGVLQLSEAEMVSVGAGEETEMDFTMRHVKTVEVSGRVLAPDGKPANGMVQLDDAGAEDYSMGQSLVSTDSDGRFTIKGVAPGSYFLMVMQQDSEAVYSERARQKVEVGSDNIDSITVALGRGSDFHGQVTADGLSFDSAHIEYLNINLTPVGTDDWMGIGAQVKKDGTFDLKHVPDGDYAVMAFVQEKPGWFLKSARLGPDDILSEGLHVDKESSGGTIHIVLSLSGAQLEGSVVEENKPVVGAHVRISPDPQTPYNRLRWKTTTTDQNGHFVILGVAPGKYQVVARSPMTPGGTPAHSDPQTVTVSEHGHEAVQLKIEPPPAE